MTFYPPKRPEDYADYRKDDDNHTKILSEFRNMVSDLVDKEIKKRKIGWQRITKDCLPPKGKEIIVFHQTKYPFAEVTKAEYIGALDNDDYFSNAYWILAPEQYAKRNG